MTNVSMELMLQKEIDEVVEKENKEAAVEEEVDVEVNEDPENISAIVFKRRSTRRRLKKKLSQTNEDPLAAIHEDALTVNVDPLASYEVALLNDVHNWLESESPNLKSQDPAFFTRLLTSYKWLTDKEIDASCFLLRKRIAMFPGTYGKHFTIGDCHFTPWFNKSQYDIFIKDKKNFKFVEALVEYCWGSPEKYMRPWSSVDQIYLPMNLENSHWVLCVVQLQEWRIDVYDCDQALFLKKTYDALMRPLCAMLPYLMKSGLSDVELRRFPNFSFKRFVYNRLPYTTVPKAKDSGDCGVFVIMYMEYLAASLLDLSNITSDNMPFWRKKWAVRLFHEKCDL